MRLSRGALAKALDQPEPAIRFYLFYGTDEAQSRAHARRLLSGLGASRLVISAQAIKSDPALLAAEAAAMSLFDGPRLIWIEPAGDDIGDGVQGLLEAPAAESAVVAIAGALRKTSALLKLAEENPAAVSCVSYMPEGQDAERMVAEVGRTLGLKVAPPVAARVAASCGNDQSVVRQELEKLALYIGASTETPRELDHDALDDVGADLPEGDFLRLADLALSGRVQELAQELAMLESGGSEVIPVIRSLQRRLLMLAPLRARVEQGESASGVMASIERSLFFKDKAVVGRLLQQWDSAGLSTVMERSGRLERDSMLTPLPPLEGLAEELIAVARVAQRR